MLDSTIKKVEAASSPRGEMGQMMTHRFLPLCDAPLPSSMSKPLITLEI
jgi:hypothetical protein